MLLPEIAALCWPGIIETGRHPVTGHFPDAPMAELVEKARDIGDGSEEKGKFRVCLRPGICQG